jgi:hypothetical protein
MSRKKEDAYKLALDLVTEQMSPDRLCWHFIDTLDHYHTHDDTGWDRLLRAADPRYEECAKKHIELHKKLDEHALSAEVKSLIGEERDNWSAMGLAWASAAFALGVANAMRFKGGAVVPALTVIEGGKKDDTLKGECNL